MPGAKTVDPTARAMPTIPYHMARFALSWFESPPSARMNKTDAAMYAAVRTPPGSSPLMSTLSEHRQHPARHEEAADDVDGGNED